MKYVVICFVVLLTSCVSSLDIQYDENFDLSSYKTYNFYPVIDSNLPEDETKQIMQIIALQLFKQGYQKSRTPDFYINFFSEENTQYVPEFSEEIDTSENNTSPSYTVSRKEKVDTNKIRLKTVAIDQLLYLDVVDVKKDQLAWNVILEGSLEDPITEEKLFNYYTEIIESALKEFHETPNQ